MRKTIIQSLNDRNIEFTAITGKVIGVTRWAETEVTSAGGYSVVAQGSGIINAPRIQSTTYQKIEFWIKEDESGAENVITLTDSNFNVKENQSVTALYTKIEGKNFGLSFLMNHNANIFTTLNLDGELSKLGRQHGLFFVVGMFIFYYLILMLCIGMFVERNGPAPSFMWIIILALIIKYIHGVSKTMAKNGNLTKDFIRLGYESINTK